MLMTQQQALEVLLRHRGDRIVVTTMSSGRHLAATVRLAARLRLHSLRDGPRAGLGLGLALAQPGRGVIVVNGDGCMLMNLGSLVTLAGHPAHVFLLILDNGLYEVTGGQAHAGAGQSISPAWPGGRHPARLRFRYAGDLASRAGRGPDGPRSGGRSG